MNQPVAPALDHGIPNFVNVAPGVWRGGQPADESWPYLQALGITRVVKLSTAKEGSDAKARAHGMKVFKFPMPWVDQTFGKPSKAKLNAAVNAIDAQAGTYVHCLHGQDRTGLVIGAYRVKVQKWDKKEAEHEMLRLGFHPLLRGLYWSWQEDV